MDRQPNDRRKCGERRAVPARLVQTGETAMAVAPVPGETAQEDVRNAMAILAQAADWGCVQGHDGSQCAVFTAADVQAVVNRLKRAVEKLEAKTQSWR